MQNSMIDIKNSVHTLSKFIGILLFLFILMGVASADTTYLLDNSVENGAAQDQTVTATVSGNSIIFRLTPNQASDGWFDQVGFPTDVKFTGMMTPNGGYSQVMEDIYINDIGYFDAVTYMVSSRPITQVTVFFDGNLPPSPIFYAKVSWSKPVTGQSFTSSIFTNIPKPIEKITPTITWNTPADIISGTSLSSEQLNAIATDPNTGNSVTGTFTYNPEAGTVLSAGMGQTLHVDFVPTDTATYNAASKDVTINVNKADPTITWSNPADIIYATALGDTQLNAVATDPVTSASVAGTFTYTPAEGTVLNADTQTLHVDFTPSDPENYSTASKDVTINVNKADPIITWSNPADIKYKTALSDTQLNAVASVPGTFVYTPSSGTVLGTGTQTLKVDFTPTDTANYNSVSQTAIINVGKNKNGNSKNGNNKNE